MKRLLYILPLVLLLLAPVLAGCSSPVGVGSGPLPAPGRAAPEIELTSLDGETIALSDLYGQPVLLNFFATWCGPCKSEMPYLQAVEDNQAYGDAGFRLLEVNIQESPATVRQFMANNNLDMTVLLDTGVNAARAYNVDGIPASFFIDRSGIIQKVKIGAYANLDALERDVQSLIDSQ